MSGAADQPPPLPPSQFPPALLERCPSAFMAASVRTARATLEVHETHLRIITPVVASITEYARRVQADDLVIALDDIDRLRPVGTISVVIELPHQAAVAVAGPRVREALSSVGDRVRIEPRQFRPFFVNFWLIHNRTGRIEDARRLP